MKRLLLVADSYGQRMLLLTTLTLGWFALALLAACLCVVAARGDAPMA